MSLKTLFRWHLWLGLVSGACMFVVGLTGAIAVFAHEIDWLVIPPLRVAAPPPGATPLDLGAIVEKVKAAYPEGRVGSLQLSSGAAFAHVAGLVARRDGHNVRVDVYVNPYTGAIQGERTVSGGYFSSVYQFLRQTHVRLLMGLWGRVFVGVLGVSLTLSCITGLYIYRGWITKLFTLRLSGGWGSRPPWAQLHKFVGVWSLVFNILIGVTGAVLGIENLVNQVESKWGRPRPTKPLPSAVAAAPRRTAPPANAKSLPLNVLLARAQAAYPDLTPRTINLPARPGGPLGIRGEVPSMLVAQSHVRSANGITLDSSSGAVLNKADGRLSPGWTRVYWMIDPLHFGYFGGLPTKIIWFVLGLTPSLLALTGTWMWWKRRAHATPPLPAAGAAATPSAIRPITVAALVLTLAGAYALVARAFHSWAFTSRLAEFWLVKPIAIALCAFPVTLVLAWLVARTRFHPWRYGGACALLGGWYLLLTHILMP